MQAHLGEMARAEANVGAQRRSTPGPPGQPAIVPSGLTGGSAVRSLSFFWAQRRRQRSVTRENMRDAWPR
jgi:hypothetical protein